MPKISVIIPIYNVEEYLPACLDSLLSQTFTDWEAVCVVDGSPDNSGEILKEYALKDSRIRAVFQENRGVSATRNRGLGLATGEYVCYLDSDDEYSPFFLERMYDAVRDGKADVAYCEHARDKEQLSTSPTAPVYHDCVFENFVTKRLNIKIYIHNKIFRRDLIKDIFFPENIAIGEDAVYIYRIMYRTEKIAHVPERLYYYRERSGSAVNSSLSEKIIMSNFMAAELLFKEFNDKSMSRLSRKYLNRRTAYRFFKFAVTEPIHSENGVHKKEWYVYTWPLLKKYKDAGIYKPQHLTLNNRIRSWLFLNFTGRQKR
ncbi:MAG: glycosyltransferase family 2 protein [Ruminobacter sp.]|nr:glycosyltransferase family 2 protein [Ruminobacter sp.]